MMDSGLPPDLSDAAAPLGSVRQCGLPRTRRRRRRPFACGRTLQFPRMQSSAAGTVIDEIRSTSSTPTKTIARGGAIGSPTSCTSRPANRRFVRSYC
jgi:hypothetical protein